MKHAKRILSILMACAMLMMVMPMAVSAAGTQDDPIDAATKWFGYGVNTYLLNPSIAEGSDGMWYTLTAEQDGILALEHKYKDVDYTITISVNGKDYVGGSVDGVIYNGPIMTLPLKSGDVATIAIVTKDAAAGTVYASMNIIAGDVDNTIKVKSEGIVVQVAAGETVYFQDDSLNAIYATKYAILSGDSVEDVTFYNVINSTTSSSVTMTPNVDSDGDGVIELAMGGSAGSDRVPAVKPAWAVENNSAVDKCFTLTLVNAAHECVYDDYADMNCNSCGAERDMEQGCQHVYDHDFDTNCNTCMEQREVELPLTITGNSISADVNGLAWLVEAKVEGITLNGTEAVYDNATVNGYKLINMGAVVSNNYTELGRVPNLDDADGEHAVDVQAKYIYTTDEEAGTVTYAIRLINIPEEHKDREINILTYIIFEDEAGVQHTLYCKTSTDTYNQYA